MLTGQLRAEVQENPYVNLSATEFWFFYLTLPGLSR